MVRRAHLAVQRWRRRPDANRTYPDPGERSAGQMVANFRSPQL